MTARQRTILSALFVFAVLATAAWLFATLMATPAEACHRFSIWKYPTAQRCAVVAQVAEDKPPIVPPSKLLLPRFTVSQYDTIILSPVQGRTDEEGRAAAIEILREVMGK